MTPAEQAYFLRKQIAKARRTIVSIPPEITEDEICFRLATLDGILRIMHSDAITLYDEWNESEILEKVAAPAA